MQLIRYPSPNFGDRRGDGPVDMLVLHYTDMVSAQEALDRLCDPAAEVSAHYLIDEDGRVYQMWMRTNAPGTRASASGVAAGT